MASGTSPIPIDSDYEAGSDGDSIDGASSRISLASSITQYRYENGRRYHAYRDGHYFAPNDDKQQAHQTISHHLFLITLNDKLFLAPLKNPRNVIDIGTGTGIWAQDFADQYPEATVIGTDLSPIQPDFRPANLHFEIDDCCSEWTYPNDHFDFIHIRFMYGSVADWPALYQECYNHLKPGGYIQQAEMSVIVKSDDGSVTPGDKWDISNKLATESSDRFGKTFLVQEMMRENIEQAGFVDIVEKNYKWPIGGWSNDPKLKELGKWNLHHWYEGLEGWSMALLTRYMGWSYEKTKTWNEDMRKVLKDRRLHVYHNVGIVYARKPL